MDANFTVKGLIYSKFGKESALADHLGWPRQRLNKITTGRRLPNIEELNAISLALDEPVDKMLHIFLRA